MKFKQRLAIGYIQTKFKLLKVISKRKTAEQAFDLFCTPMRSKETLVKPNNSEITSFTFQNLKINGYRWNYPKKEKVLILHGFNSSAAKFEAYALLLIQKGYEVLAFDAPAHGNSEGEKINALLYSDFVEAIITKYGPINKFICHSFGGLALSLVIERIPHTSDTKMVLIAPATETSSAIDSAFALLKINDTQVRKEFEKIIFTATGKQSEWYSISRAVKNIKAQILWLHDETDLVTPFDDALKVKELLQSNVKFIITNGLGHQKIYHDVNVKNAVVNFL